MTEVESEILKLEEAAACFESGKRLAYRLAGKAGFRRSGLRVPRGLRRSELNRWAVEGVGKNTLEADCACASSATQSHPATNRGEIAWCRCP